MKRKFLKMIFLFLIFIFNLSFSEKKIIYYGWATRDTIFVRENWQELDKLPFDGIGISVAIDRKRPTTGNGATGNLLGWNLFGDRKFKYDEFKEAIEDLKVPKWKNLKENFLACAVATKGQDKGLNWFDDTRWEIIYNNWEIFIRIAKEGNLKGIFVDFEHYDYDCELFRYAHHKAKREDRPFAEYKEKAKQRGRDIMKITKRIFPDIIIFYSTGYSMYFTDKFSRGGPEEEVRYSLLPSFLDGMLSELGENMKFVEIASVDPELHRRGIYPYGYTEEEHFRKAYETVKTKCLSVTEYPEIFKKRVSAGFALSFDYPHREFNTEELSKNYFTPEKFAYALENGLKITDEYLWIYTGTLQTSTFIPGKDYIDKYLEAIRKVREKFKLKNISFYRGYKCKEGKIELLDGGKELRVIWEGILENTGSGGIEINLPPTDLRNKNFILFVRPITNVVPTLFFSLYDEKGRVSMNAWHNIKIGENNRIIIKVGDKGSSNYFEKARDEFDKITKILIYFNSKKPNEKAEVIFGEFKEVENLSEILNIP
jgi:hypothetical protein